MKFGQLEIFIFWNSLVYTFFLIHYYCILIIDYHFNKKKVMQKESETEILFLSHHTLKWKKSIRVWYYFFQRSNTQSYLFLTFHVCKYQFEDRYITVQWDVMVHVYKINNLLNTCISVINYLFLFLRSE